MRLPIFIILILFLLLNFSHNVTSDSSAEACALLNWKTSLQNQNLNSSLLSSWTLYPTNASKISPCSWFGISCNHAGSRVISINLSTLCLNGTFQDFSFSSFPHLVNLNLSFNLFFGNIPPQIGNLSKLQNLDLGNNQLSGVISPEIGKLNQLRRLYLDMNQLHGTIPPVIGQLSLIHEFSFCHNNVSGRIPSSLDNLSNLDTLFLYKNSLSGSIPSIIGNLKSLHQLDLIENQLSGSIPLSFGNLSSWTLMSLFSNSLSGSIPPILGNLKSLSTLGLYLNQLNGVIPPSIGNLSSLRNLSLFNNGLYGSIPEEIGYLKSLSELKLCKNNLSGRVRFNQNNLVGKVYEAFGDHPNLTFLDLSQNNFDGKISFNWRNLPKLDTFIVSMNNIFGSIPLEIGDSSKLQFLDLSSNHIVGKIPVQLEKLFSLNKLILSLNQLSGSVPLEFGSLTELQYLDLSANKLSSSIPKSIGNLLKLYYLNLSNNQFSHTIPIEFEKLIHLSKLDLSHNILQEEIPPQVCNMESLEKLNLSHNNLSGFIPRCFEKMRSLSCIDICYNELQGPIPNSTVFKDGLMEGNKGLKKDSQEEQTISMNPLRLLSVLNFDGKIMHEEIIKATDDFDEKFCIGKGGQGSVYKAELPSGDIVAVKKFNSQLLSGNMADQDEFLNVVLALNEIRHRNIVKFHGFCSNARHSFLVCEYLHRGSLARILGNDATAKELSWNRRINVIKGVANALSYLHHDCLPSIIHRDISSKNVLLDLEFEAHVSDFGIAKFVEPYSSNRTEFVGTFGYAAPEIAYTMRATEKYDVYSFGVLVFEVIKGNHPRDFFSINFSSFSNMIIEVNQILDPRLSTPSPGVMDKLISIMEVAILCLDESPEARPTMEKILAVILAIEASADYDSSKEAFALLKWKRSLQNKNISLLSSWTLHFDNASNVPSHSKPKISPCAWVGISCNQVGRVISIDLSSMGLNGALQKFAFSSFPHLMHFNLSFNLFFGIIPPQVGNLSELLHLDLGNN
ncbi:hypothetical protein CUMW_059570 [Citrus unshiu]|nr:hypothetical protein CUMW_059570 [Citrus unshiu]